MENTLCSNSILNDFQQQAELALKIFCNLSDDDKILASSFWNLLAAKIQSQITNNEHRPSDGDGDEKRTDDGQDPDANLMRNRFDSAEVAGILLHTPPTLDDDIVIDNVWNEVNRLEAGTELLSVIKTEYGCETPCPNLPSDPNSCISEMLEPPISRPDPAPAILPEMWNCSFCSSAFDTKKAQEEHLKLNHVKDKRFKCEQCPASFTTKGNFNVHLRSHSHNGEKPFECTKCSSRFATSSNLRRHTLSHQGLKPYRCSTCQSCFTEKRSLIIHSRKHTGERPFPCPQCPKTFMQSSVLQNHLTVHTNEKKFICQLCSKSFKQKAHLVRHKAYVHKGVKNKVCLECNCQFVTKSDLKRHINSKVHTGEKTLLCAQCGSRFRRQDNLMEHINTVHTSQELMC